MINTGHEPRKDEITRVLPSLGPTTSPEVEVRVGARTDVGKVRKNNEDQYLVARLNKSIRILATSLPHGAGRMTAPQDAYLFVVADGMGGPAAGEVASAWAVERVEAFVLGTIKWFIPHGDPDEADFLEEVGRALTQLDRDVIKAARNDRSLAGMGTTLTSACSIGSQLRIFHVGDSRAYRYRRGTLTQLTTDHNLSQLLVEGGMLRPEDVRRHKGRHIVTNVIGGPEAGVNPDVINETILDGDRLLLCTDGLVEGLRDDEIAATLLAHPDPVSACHALIDATLARGAPDNVTAVVADYTIRC